MTKQKAVIYQVGEYITGSGNGVNEYIYQLTNLLSEQFQFNFIYFDQDEDKVAVEDLNDHTKVFHFPRFKLKGLKISPVFEEWLGQVPKHCIFHIHSVFRINNYPTHKTILKKNHKVIFTPHDSYSKNSMKKKWVLKKLFLALFDKAVLDNVSLVHAISPEGYKDMSKLTTNKIWLAPNFFYDHYQKENPDFEKLKQQICYIGRLDIYQKGIDLQLKAFQRFTKMADTKFVLGGRYEPKELKKFNKILASLGLAREDNIQLAGYISNDEKHNILINSYVYLQLSRFEGFGLSIVEALSFCKPIIISEQVPFSEEIIKYNAGFVVKNEIEAGKALDKIFGLPEKEYMEICANARNCFLKVFSPEIAKAKLSEMFNSVLK